MSIRELNSINAKAAGAVRFAEALIKEAKRWESLGRDAEPIWAKARLAVAKAKGLNELLGRSIAEAKAELGIA